MFASRAIQMRRTASDIVRTALMVGRFVGMMGLHGHVSHAALAASTHAAVPRAQKMTHQRSYACAAKYGDQILIGQL
jgi:hypothetical protein